MFPTGLDKSRTVDIGYNVLIAVVREFTLRRTADLNLHFTILFGTKQALVGPTLY
jgi:hypothetical protein